MAETKVSYLWRTSDLGQDALTGVSLHGHTNRSKESLYFIPQLAEQCPMMSAALQKQCAKSATGVDFARAYWTPPLSPKLAYELEKNQIENVLGLPALVALTDHDNIEAPTVLRDAPETSHVPVSLEWSVPFRGTIFHLGVHNLPAARAPQIVADLVAYTQDPHDARLVELLAMLDAMPEVMVVFNHPLWNHCQIGRQRDAGVLDRFLNCGGRFLHAMEFNATRKMAENKATQKLADRWKLPLVAGGDRHGCEPSGALNVTRAQEFPEFVREVRKEKRSHVVVMQQYTTPLSLRTARTFLDVIREYPEFPAGTRRWEDRIFHPDPKNREVRRPVATLWKVAPPCIERIMDLFRVLENTAVRRACDLLFESGRERDTPVPSERSSEAAS